MEPFTIYLVVGLLAIIVAAVSLRSDRAHQPDAEQTGLRLGSSDIDWNNGDS